MPKNLSKRVRLPGGIYYEFSEKKQKIIWGYDAYVDGRRGPHIRCSGFESQEAVEIALAPTCSSNCGNVSSVVGTDTFMRVTMGNSGSPASGWVVTFNGTWAATRVCVVQMTKAGMVVGKMPLTINDDHDDHGCHEWYCAGGN